MVTNGSGSGLEFFKINFLNTELQLSWADLDLVVLKPDP